MASFLSEINKTSRTKKKTFLETVAPRNIEAGQFEAKLEQPSVFARLKQLQPTPSTGSQLSTDRIGFQDEQGKPISVGESIQREEAKQVPRLSETRSVLGDIIKPEQVQRVLQTTTPAAKVRTEQTLGAVSKLPLIGSTLVSPETIEKIKPQQTIGATIPESVPFIGGTDIGAVSTGEAATKVGSQIAQYAEINRLLSGLNANSVLGKFLGGSKIAKFGAQQLTDLTADAIVQAPLEFAEAVNNDKSIGEDVKQVLINRGWDALFNVAIGAFSREGREAGQEALAKIKAAYKQSPEIVEQALKTADPNVAKSIQQELGISEDVTAKQFLEQQTKDFEADQAEDVLKQFDRTPAQITEDFQTWRKQNFGGATGQVPADEMQALKDLYKQDTGIDLDVAIKEVQPQESFIEAIKTQPAKTDLSTTVEMPVDRTRTMAADIETPKFDDNTLIVDMPTVAKGEPIDTKSLVTTELPKKSKQTLGERYDRAFQEIVGKYDFLGKVSEKARTQSSNLNRTLGSIEHNVVGNQTDMLGNNIGKSVTDIFENVKGEEKQDLFNYIFHKHNIDRAAQGKPVFGETIDSDFSRRFVQDFESKNPNAVQTQQEITNYFKNILNEWAVPSGLTSADTAEFLNDLYKNYVPTVRVKNLPKSLSQGNQTVAQILKKAKGGDDAILPLDQMMIMQTDRVIKNARKNEMLNTLADAFEKGEGNVSKRVFEIKGSDAEVLDDAFDIGKNLDVEPVASGDDYLINFYRDGKPMEMRVDKVTYEAFKPANFDNVASKAAQVFKKYATNPFKSLITEYNPAFSVANVLRDIPTALTFSDNALNMTKKVPDAIKQILTNGEKYRQFKALGGTREGLIGAGKEFKVPTLTDKTALQKIAKQVNKANPFKRISDVNKFTETVPRFSEYLAVLEKTGDPALAIYKSADLTTDFAKHGNTTKLLDSFVPYLNPQVQGMDKFARSIIKSPIKTAAGAGAAITVPTIILDQINKDDPEYNNLSPREKNLYFQIPYTNDKGEKQFIRIPKSRELGVAFSSIYDWAARAARGEKVTGEEIKQTIEENFGVGITPLWEPAKKAWDQIKDPDAYETNYWGGLIVPQSQRKYSPGEQYDLNSSGIAKAIGQQFDISPFVVDYLIKSYTGVAGQFVQPIGADRKKDILDPLTKRFKTDPVFKSDATNKFYTLLDKTTKEANDFNRINDLPTSGPENIVTPLEEKASGLRKIAAAMTDLRKEQKALQVKKGNEDKLRALQEAINKLADDAVRSSK